MVLAVHLQEQLARAGYSIGLFDFGSAGVDVFFVISGFVMWHSTQKEITPLAFYYRRIIRIVPLYWLLTSVMLVILLIAPQLLNSAQFDLGHIAASYLFIAQPHPVLDGAMFPLLVPGWTLNYEMFFYALFGISLLLKRDWQLYAMVSLLGGLSVINVLAGIEPGVADFYTNPILLEFVAGMLLGKAVDRGASLGGGWALALVLLGSALLIAHFDTIRFVRDGIGAIMIVSAFALYEARKSIKEYRFPMLIGDSSYSLYLSHVLVLAALTKALQLTIGADSPAYAFAYILLAIGITLVTAVILYKGFEKPTLALLRRS